MQIKPRLIAKNKSVIITAVFTFLTILWNIVDAVSNLEFIVQKAGYQNEVTNFLVSSAPPKIAFFLAISALVLSLLFKVEHEELKKQFYETPENDLTPETKEGVKLPLAKKSDERIVVDVTLDYILGFFKEHTNTQAQKLIEIYIGKWIKISGEVSDVNEIQNVVQVYLRKVSQNSIYQAFFLFEDQANKDRAKLLRREQKITVFGKVIKADPHTIYLENCEFVKENISD